MTRWVKIPNLPCNKVTQVLVDAKTPEKIIAALQKMDIKVYKTYVHDKLDGPVAGHADMQFIHIGENRAVCALDLVSYYRKLLPDMDIIAGETYLEPIYPQNIAYNAFALNKHLFGKIEFVDARIKSQFAAKVFKFVNINQGYAKCSVCIVDEHSIITSDKGIYKEVRELGFDALLIRPGHISLPGYNYGFIGGCCGKLSSDIICFTGNIALHPDYNLIREFILSKRVSIINLTDDELIDIGGIIPIAES